MCRKLIYVMTFVLALGSTANAALYVWNGSAADGLWETPANWTVTDSLWTWPNEENAADPNLAKNINSDALGIDILNGEAVSRGSDLAIQGAPDGSTTAVLTLNNGSSLTVSGRLAIGGVDGSKGQIDILGGSTVTVVGDGNDLRLVDNDNTWGVVNIVDSTVNIADDLNTDQGEGYINISGSSIINADDIIAGDGATSVGYVDISGTATINVDELKTDDGEGHITIGGNAILNLDDLMIDKPTGVGTIDISGAATVTIVDDVEIDDATGTLNIGGTAAVSNGDDFKVGDDGPGVGTTNIGDDATVTVGDILYVAHNADSEGHLTISGNATVDVLDDLIIANAAGVTATLHISGNPTIHVTEQFYMNDDSSDPMLPSASKVIMDGGTVTIDSYCTFNDDNNGTAEFIMNGGRLYCADYLNLSDNLDGTAHLTMNGGEMITGNQLRLGKDGGEDTGQVRIFMNGGLLQAEELDIKITDTMIVFSGGDFRINSASVSEDGMRQLITDGTIVPTGVYNILTDGAYTVLSAPPVPPGANIIWVTETMDNDIDGVQDDQAFVDWLVAEGHTVDTRLDYWSELDLEPGKVDELNAADLVIVSRSTSSGNFDEGDEPTLWNSVTTPIILMNGYIVRSSRWLWMDTTTIVKGDDILLALDPTHPLFDGVTLEMGNMVIFRDNTVGMGITSFVGSIDVGNGTLIAQTLSADNAWIAEWPAGVEFYAGSGQIAGGPRMLFVAGTQEVNADPQGAWDLTADGEQMLRNAINYLVP